MLIALDRPPCALIPTSTKYKPLNEADLMHFVVSCILVGDSKTNEWFLQRSLLGFSEIINPYQCHYCQKTASYTTQNAFGCGRGGV